MRNVRHNFQQIAAATTEYHAIGPFAINERLDSLLLQLSADETGGIVFGPVLHPTPDASAATIAAGSNIIEVSDQQLAGANALQLHSATAATDVIVIPLRTNPLTAQTWVHVAIYNKHATKPLFLLMTVTAHTPESSPVPPEPHVAPASPA